MGDLRPPPVELKLLGDLDRRRLLCRSSSIDVTCATIFTLRRSMVNYVVAKRVGLFSVTVLRVVRHRTPHVCTAEP